MIFFERRHLFEENNFIYVTEFLNKLFRVFQTPRPASVAFRRANVETSFELQSPFFDPKTFSKIIFNPWKRIKTLFSGEGVVLREISKEKGVVIVLYIMLNIFSPYHFDGTFFNYFGSCLQGGQNI